MINLQCCWLTYKYIYIYIYICSKTCMEYASIYFVFNKCAKWTLWIYSTRIFSQLFIVICDFLARHASLHKNAISLQSIQTYRWEKNRFRPCKKVEDLSKSKNYSYLNERYLTINTRCYTAILSTNIPITNPAADSVAIIIEISKRLKQLSSSKMQ